MKKKLIPLILASMCATACAFGLAACGDKNDATGIIVTNTETGSEELIVNTTYGEKPNLDYKLYATYKNGDKKEIPFTDKNLTVRYYYLGESEPLQKLPDELLSGTYTIQYDYAVGKSNFRAYVSLNVAQAESSAFRIEPERTTWYVGDGTPYVTLKNPKGSTVKIKDNDDALQPDDTNGNYFPYMMKKSDYDTLTAAQKTDYDYINDLYAAESEKPEGSIWLYLSDFVEYSPVGEYMLFVAVESTHNYCKSVTPAVKVNIKDTFIERTFIFQNIVVQDGKGNTVTDTNNELAYMAENMNVDNQGKTLVCKANGELRGTVDLGNDALDELSGEDVYKYSTYATRITINTQDDRFVGDGEVSNDTLTLKMSAGANFYFVLTFTSK